MKFLSALAFSLLLVTSSFSQTLDELFKPVKYRNIGPFRGGRSINASEVVNDPFTYYMGTTGGGLWKTDDAGQRWSNISVVFSKLVL